MQQLKNKKIFVALLLLLLAYSPMKSLNWLVFFIFILFNPNFLLNRKFIIFQIVIFSINLFIYLTYSNYLILNYIFALISFSSFYLFFYEDKYKYSELKIITYFYINLAFVESIIGIIQSIYNALILGHGFDGSTGDNVMGTITLSLITDGSGSNNMFALLQSFAIIIYFITKDLLSIRIAKYKIISIILSWILASVVHTIIYFILALVFTAVVIKFAGVNFDMKNKKMFNNIYKYSLIIIAISLLFLTNNLTHNLMDIIKYGTSFENSNSIKAFSLYISAFKLPDYYFLQPFIGLGSGQYTSRVSLLLSNSFFHINLPLKSFSKPLYDLIYPLWEPYYLGINQIWGSSFFPYFSWLTIYTEFGLLGIGLIITFIYKRILSIINLSRFIPVYTLFFMITFYFYLILLGFQENYYEWLQPIFFMVFCSQILYNYIRSLYEDNVYI